MGSGLALPGLTVVLTAAALMQGAYYIGQLQIVVVVAAMLWVASWRDRVPVRTPLVAIAFTVLAAGLTAGMIANRFPSMSLKPVLTLVSCVLVYSLAARAATRDGSASVLDLIVALASTVVAAGLIGVAFHLHVWAFEAGTWRLASTLTYQNAAASLCAIALPPALVRADRRWPRIAAVVLAAGLAATQSRGGAVAALVGVAIVARVRPVPGASRLALGAAVATAAMIPAIAGVSFAAIIAMPGMLAGAALAAAVPREQNVQAATTWWPAVAAVAAVVALAVWATPISDRFIVTSNDRGRVWRATMDLIGTAPVFGSGPGTFVVRDVVDGVRVRTVHAHNEYLQTAAETGFVGLALVLTAIAAFAAALIRSRPPLRTVTGADAARLAAAASGVAFLIHSGFDFLWRLPVLPALCFALLAAGLTTDRSPPSP